MSELNYTNTSNGTNLDPNVNRNKTMDHIKETADEVRATAQGYIERGTTAVREGSAKLKDSVSHISDRTATYVHEQPVKSVLLAAAAGAAIAMFASMITSSRSRH